jgi:SAM-dependent methyltransferase
MTDTRDREPKKVVRDSDNRISRAYRSDAVRRDRGYFRWLAVLTPLLQPGDSVLDLGCGCGIPVAQALAHTFRVTGVDISAVQITRAQALVPEAALLCQDIMAVHFPPQTLQPSVAERSFSFLDRVQMFVKPMPQPLLRRSRQLQDKMPKTQGLEDRKIATRIRNDVRSSPTPLSKRQRLPRLVGDTSTRRRVRKQMVAAVAQDPGGNIKHDRTVAR